MNVKKTCIRLFSFGWLLAAIVSCGAIISYKGNLSRSTKILSLSTNYGEIALAEGVNEYTISVPHGTDSIQLRVVLEEPSAHMTICGFECASGQWSPSLRIRAGHALMVPIIVSAGNSNTGTASMKTCTLKVDPEKAWSEPKPLVPFSEGLEQVMPQIAENDAGLTVAVWWQRVGSSSYWDLMASEKDDRTDWSSPVRLSQYNNNTQDFTLDINEAGDIVVVWINDNAWNVCAAFMRAGAWLDCPGGVVLGSASTGYKGNYIDCAIDGRGNAVVVRAINGQVGIYENAMLVSSNTWTPAIEISDSASSVAVGGLDLVVNNNDFGYITWIEMPGSNPDLMARSIQTSTNAVGRWYSLLDSTTAFSGTLPHAAVFENNSAVIVWFDGLTKALYSTTISPTDGPCEIITKISGSIECTISSERNCFFSNKKNNISVALGERFVNSGLVQYNLFSVSFNEGKWSEPMKINHTGITDLYQPHIWANGDQRAALVYKTKNIEQYQKATLAVFDGAWKTEINSPGVYAVMDSVCASIDSAGEVSCIWAQTPVGGLSSIMVGYYK
jgi:hypothetical protein